MCALRDSSTSSCSVRHTTPLHAHPRVQLCVRACSACASAPVAAAWVRAVFGSAARLWMHSTSAGSNRCKRYRSSIMRNCCCSAKCFARSMLPCQHTSAAQAQDVKTSTGQTKFPIFVFDRARVATKPCNPQHCTMRTRACKWIRWRVVRAEVVQVKQKA